MKTWTSLSALIFCLWLMLGLSVTADTTAAPPSAWIRVNDDDAAVAYSANVEKTANNDYFNKDLHDTQTIGEWCKFSFAGTGVKWIGSKNTDHGKADVFIDGKLDATIDTTATSWQFQQELYVKTGLIEGPHQLMIQVKTPGYQDFDAFEYWGTPPPPPAPPAPKNLGNVVLPDQVPYLNPKQRYPLGNGVAMAVGEANGQWSQLSGPGYTTPNFINSESLTLEVDGIVEPLSMEMKRAAKTGIYYGYAVRGDLQVRLIDYACPGEFWLSRLILIDNTSTKDVHDVRVRAIVAPKTAAGYTPWLVKDSDQKRCGVAIQADTTVTIPSNGENNIANRSVIISFTDPATTARVDDRTYTIEAPLRRIAPGGSYSIALTHYFREDATSDAQCVATIRALKSVDELEKSIIAWQKWFDDVPPAYQLSRVKDERARELMEGGLAILKTNQSKDGGIVVHATYYKEGYIRDALMALRALTATGHFEESKQWLIWVDHKVEVGGHLSDLANCMVSLSEKNYALDFGDLNAEIPADVLIGARDYYDSTHDLDTLKSVDKTLQYCMDVQLKEADANGFKLSFNGDETEMCGVVNPSPSGSGINAAAAKNDWAMSSVALCAASLDFYMKYLHACGEDLTNYKNSQSGVTVNLKTEMASLLKTMDDEFWRTDVPEIPEGFHDAFRLKADNSWPKKRIVNFTLFPVYYGTPCSDDRKAKDVRAIAHYFDEKTGFLQLVPGSDSGFEGHDLGYLLWGLIEIHDPRKDEVYKALVNGPTVDCWGSYNEAYSATGQRNDHDLRSLETGVDISALAKYWNLGP
jgi:hypothetical protein